jgi:hypothetical protein
LANQSQKNTPSDAVPVNSFSVLKKAKLVNSPGISPNLISQINNVDSKILREADEKKSSYMKFVKFSQNELATNMTEIYKNQKSLNTFLYDNNMKINPIFQVKPRYLIAMAFYLNLNLTDITTDDIENTSLSNSQLFKIKSFSESNDFMLHLKRGDLIPEDIQRLVE